MTVSHVGDNANPSNLMDSGQLGYTYTPPDITPPTILSAELTGSNLLKITFNETIEEVTALDKDNYFIEPNVAINDIQLDVSKRQP